MNYSISQILDFETCNAGIPSSLIRDAAVETIRENWQSDLDLAEAFEAGTLDLAAEAQSINESLAEAGCETRTDAADLKQALAHWVEMETLKGNI